MSGYSRKPKHKPKQIRPSLSVPNFKTSKPTRNALQDTKKGVLEQRTATILKSTRHENKQKISNKLTFEQMFDLGTLSKFERLLICTFFAQGNKY